MNPWRPSLKLILLALGVLLLGLAPYPRPVSTAMRQARAHRAAREYGAALAAYRRAAELVPGSPRPWLQMGNVYLLQQRSAPAIVAFLAAQRRGGGLEALLGLGESYAMRGDWNSAIQSWLHAQTLAPDDPRVYVGLGQANLGQSHFDQARDYLTQALQLQPSGAQAAAAHALLGRLLAGDDPALAADHFRQAGDQDMLAVLETVAAEANPARRAQLLGIAALQRNDLTLARHHFERAIAGSASDAETLAYLAHTLDQLSETVAARGWLERALEQDGDSALVYYFLGTHHRLVGNLEAAKAALWQGLLLDPENAALRAEMARTFEDQSDYPQAEEWYAGAVEAAPSEVDFHLMLVRFYVNHLYRVQEAGLPAAQALVDLVPGDARAYDLLGWAYHLVGLQADARQNLLQALSLDPDLVSAHYHLGSLYLFTGQGERARWHLQRAADLDTAGYYRARAEGLLGGLE
ncbi:MAG: tetratricopeptide repeat protein [Anaerolineae bacterium]|jgi:Flp pilus assembly protein TadD